MQSLKRVLWISDYFPRPHDMTTGVWALETIFAIQKLGVQVVVLAPTPWIPSNLALTKNLREWSSVPCEFKIRNLPVFFKKCPYYPHRLITRYFYNFLPFFESSLIWYWCEEAISQIFDRYPFQAIHSNFIFPNGFIGLKIKHKYGIPLVVHERSTQRLNAAKNHLLRRNIYSQVVREADIVITLNHKMADLIKEVVPREINIISAAANIETSHTLIDEKPVSYRRKKVILSVGALIERKGHEYLIKAISYIKDEFPNIICIIIGAGVCLRSLKKLKNDLSLDDMVQLYGKRPHDEVLRAMSWCDVFVLPSWNEAFGTVYAEAMAFAKPIIACAGEGISEVLQDGVQGLLVRKKDVNSLAEALKKILSDENLSSRLGRAGKVLADEKLNYNFIASRMIDLYKQIII